MGSVWQSATQFVQPRKLGLWVALVAVVLDVFAKQLALAYLFASWQRVSVLPGYFSLTPAWNRGVSFSFFADVSQPLQLFGHQFPADVWLPATLTLVALVASAVFVWLLRYESHWLGQVGMGLIIGGAVGNMLDRLQHGAVVDFLHFYYQNWHFPVFNLADSALSVGVVLLILASFRHNQKIPNNKDISDAKAVVK